MDKVAIIIKLLKGTIVQYFKDDCPRLAAALSFYTLFSISPLLLIVIVITGFLLGQEAAQGGIVSSLSDIIGEKGASLIQVLILSISEPSSSLFATTAGILLSLYGASHVFNHLNISLNRIWNIKTSIKNGIGHAISRKVFLIILVIGTGMFFLFSLIISASLSQIISFLHFRIPYISLVIEMANSAISFVFTILAFSLIFRYVPDVKISWKPLLVGSILTASLFSLSKWGVSLYLEFSVYGSVYNAAASLIILLIWIYYSSQILFLGAEFIQKYAFLCGKPIRDLNGNIPNIN